MLNVLQFTDPTHAEVDLLNEHIPLRADRVNRVADAGIIFPVRMRMKFDWQQIKPMLRQAWRKYKQHDMRWSYLAVGILIVCGTLVNLVFAHGWTVWPFVFSAGMLLMLHEAVDRNGQGVPPMYAYALLGSGVAFGCWLS